MAYAKLHDTFYSHPKITDLETGPCFAEAVALWAMCVSWCSAQLSDGVIPKIQLRKLVPFVWEPAASELVRVGFWTDTTVAFVFHDWTEHQKSAHRIQANRQGNAERQRRHRATESTSRVTSRVTVLDVDALRNAPVTRSDKGVKGVSKGDIAGARDSETSRALKPKKSSGHEIAMADPRVADVLATYREVHKLSAAWKAESLENKRSRAEHVLRALNGDGCDQLTADEIKLAIRGNHANAWHREHTKHELSYVLRGDKVRQFIAEAKSAGHVPTVDVAGAEALDKAIADAERAYEAAQIPKDGEYSQKAVDDAWWARNRLYTQRNKLLGISA